MEITLEALRNDDGGLNAASRGLSSSKIYRERHLDGKSYFALEYTGCFKKNFTALKAYRNLYRGHAHRFELSKCSKTHRVLPRIVMVQCDFHW